MKLQPPNRGVHRVGPWQRNTRCFLACSYQTDDQALQTSYHSSTLPASAPLPLLALTSEFFILLSVALSTLMVVLGTICCAAKASSRRWIMSPSSRRSTLEGSEGARCLRGGCSTRARRGAF